MQYELKIRSRFSAAHRIRDYGGKCEELHGHNWLVEVVVGSDEIDANGLVIDFRDLKNSTEEVLESVDHRFLNDVPPFDKANPTSENISKYICEQVSSKLPGGHLQVIAVTVWESEDACATYRAPGGRVSGGGTAND